MTPLLRERWRSLATRERVMVSAAATVVVLGLVYALLIEPAWQGRARLLQELPALRAELASMDAMASEARALSSQVSATIAPQRMRQAVEASLERAGLSGELAQIGASGNDIELRLRNAQFAAVLDWLAVVQRELRVRPTRVEVARAEGGTVAAQIVLGLPRGGGSP